LSASKCVSGLSLTNNAVGLEHLKLAEVNTSSMSKALFGGPGYREMCLWIEPFGSVSVVFVEAMRFGSLGKTEHCRIRKGSIEPYEYGNLFFLLLVARSILE